MAYPAKLSPDAIVRRATELLERGDPAALSMRSLAAELGVRASSLYGHFPDRAALEAAIADGAASRLRATLLAAAHGLEPQAALRAACHGYLSFAHSHPALYDLLLAPRPPAAATPGAGKDLWNAVLGLVSDVTGILDDTSASVALWAYLHGYLALERSGQFGLSGPQGGFETGLNALIEGFAPSE